jgi:peptidoglycan hydrolase-like protein with peptidoglycan-binding domain
MPGGWTQRQEEGVCATGRPAGEGGGEAVAISGSVGSGGANRFDDVRKIQEALNRVPPEKGGPLPPLVVDGLCGPKTVAAILRFQKAQGVVADGRVDPGQATLSKLNTVLGATRPAGSPRRERVVGFLAQALDTVRAARGTLQMAAPWLERSGPGDGSPGDSAREARLALLEKHFRISEQAFPRAAADRILAVYDRMDACFQRPGGLWGPAIFDDSPFPPVQGSRALAYVYAGGYDCQGLRDGALRMDTIYLCARLDVVPNDQVVMTIVHELAHFVGPTVLGAVEDHAYGWVDGARMRTLPAAWRPFNAECYNNFAFDARHHRAPMR